MIIYHVVEYITDGWTENADGYYSTLEQAQQAILERVAENYTPEEMKHFEFEEEGYSYDTPENDSVVGCTYIIFRHRLDEPIG